MSNAANKKFTELIMYSISLTSVGFCDIILPTQKYIEMDTPWYEKNYGE